MDNTPEFIVELPDEANLTLPSPALVNFYKDAAERMLWIDTEITDDTLSFIHYIIQWNREDAGIPIDKRKPIRILFNSPGGSLDVEETLVSIIKLSETPIYGIALGMVASAASLIYLACHKRFALSNAYFLVHQGSCQNMSGSFDVVQAAMRDYEQAIEKMTRFYIENTNYSEAEVRDKIRTDWYIYPEEALEKGIIHEMITNMSIFM